MRSGLAEGEIVDFDISRHTFCRTRPEPQTRLRFDIKMRLPLEPIPGFTLYVAGHTVQSGELSRLAGVSSDIQGRPKRHLPRYVAEAVVIGDFNRDGKQDLAVAGYNGVAIFFGNGQISGRRRL